MWHKKSTHIENPQFTMKGSLSNGFVVTKIERKYKMEGRGVETFKKFKKLFFQLFRYCMTCHTIIQSAPFYIFLYRMIINVT